MKKNLQAVLCLLFCLALLFTGCTGNGATDAETAEKTTEKAAKTEEKTAEKTEEVVQSNITEPGTFPIVNEQVELTLLASVSSDPNFDVENNLFTKELEEQTNLKLKWIQYSDDNLQEHINLEFASGNYFDAFVTGVGNANRLSKSREAQLGSQGLITPLNDLIANQSVWFQMVLDEQEGLEEYITTPDGNIYSLPNISDGYHTNYLQKLWINQTWLDNLGLNMPTTTEEFKAVMMAFKEQDANGNGDPDDEIPFSTVIAGGGVEIDGFLMSPFIYNDVTKLWVRDGKVVLSPVEPEYKEGLMYLNDLYENGLINPDSFTQDRQTQVNINENGDDPVIGAFAAMRPGYGANLNASTKWHQYQPALPLKGPEGNITAAYYPYGKFQTGMVSITAVSEHKEEAFRLFDMFYSPDVTMRSLKGREGMEWEKAGADEKGLDGSPALYKDIKYDGQDPDFANAKYGQMFPTYRPKEWSFAWVYPQDPYDPDVSPSTGRMILFYNGSKPLEEVAPPIENILPDMYYSEADIEELALLKTTIMDYINEFVASAITGKVDIEAEWDNYINELKNLGLDRYLEIIQKTYDAR